MNIINHSYLFRFFAAIAAFFTRQWESSGLVSRFLGGARVNGGVFGALWERVTRLLRRIFKALRLDKLLVGSMFLKPHFWCALAMALAPIIPTMLAAGLAIAAFFSIFLTHGATEQTPSRSPMNRYIILYALLYTAAVFLSVTPSGSLKHGALHVLFVLFAVGFGSAIRTEKQLLWTMRFFVISGALVSAYGIYQYLFGAIGAAAWVDSEMFSSIGLRVYSTLENPNVLAEYLLLTIPFSMAFVVFEKNWLARIFFVGTTGVMLLCMVLTYARGAWLGLIFAVAVFLIMIDRRLIFLGIIGLVALYFVLPDSILDRFSSIGNLTDGSTSYRVSIWMATIAMLRDFWLVGVGPGVAAYNRIYPIYGYNAVNAPHSHNLFLQIICDAGVFALVIFVMLLFSYVRELATAIKRNTNRELNIFRIAALSAMAGFVLQGMTDYSFYNYRVTLTFWCVIGLAIALTRIGKEQKND